MATGEFEWEAESTEWQTQQLLPADFIAIGNLLGVGADRKLGYWGDERFVLFHYEPRGQEILWQDGQSYGFALGGWRFFQEHIEPVMHLYDAHIGSLESHGTHVLVVDRLLEQAYFAERDSAERFLARESHE